MYSNKRIEWENNWSEGQDMYYAMMQINAEWMDRMRRRGGGGGGGSYADRINNLHSDPRGWSYNESTREFHNGRTGEVIDARNPAAAFYYMGVDFRYIDVPKALKRIEQELEKAISEVYFNHLLSQNGGLGTGGMMYGDPKNPGKILFNENQQQLMAAHLMQWIKFAYATTNDGYFDIKDAFLNIKYTRDGQALGINICTKNIIIDGKMIGFAANVALYPDLQGNISTIVHFNKGDQFHRFSGIDNTEWSLNRSSIVGAGAWSTQTRNLDFVNSYLYGEN